MQETENTRIVRDAYAAFARGDIDSILGSLADDVVWRPVIGASRDVPFAGERRGREHIRDFFERVGSGIQFDQFEPKEFVAQGDKVVALGHYRGRPTGSSKTMDSDFVMVFTLKNGKVTHFQEFLDVAQLNAAYAK